MAAAAAQTDAYERALRPLLPRAGAYALALLRSRADAEDAVQTAALKGLGRIQTYDHRRPFKGWWFAILRNVCMDQLRGRMAARTTPLDGDYPEPAAEAGFDWTRLDNAIAGLPPAHREMLRLRYFGDLSYAELAEALKIPVGTVMSRLHSARKALAGLMQERDA